VVAGEAAYICGRSGLSQSRSHSGEIPTAHWRGIGTEARPIEHRADQSQS
jgi:hypothetical protein